MANLQESLPKGDGEPEDGVPAPDVERQNLYPTFSPFTGIESLQVDEAVVVRKLNRHLIPCFFTLAVCCYLDRSSLAFSSLQLMDDLGFSKTVYGLGAGIFFVGYATLQVPSNLILARLGAPTWLAILIACWGVVDASQAAIQTPTHFFLLRFLLGVAECGAFPGMWYHLHLFHTSDELGVAYSAVASATALSQVIGGPLAGAILAMDGLAGLRGWQLLFILQGLPTIGLGLFIKAYLAESPATAKFLSPTERAWLVKRQDSCQVKPAGERPTTARAATLAGLREAAQVCRNWRVWYLGLVWFLVDATQYGVLFWCPLLLEALLQGDFNGGPPKGGVTGRMTQREEVWEDVKLSVMSAGVFAPAAAAMILNAIAARAAGERRYHSAVPVAIGGICLGLIPTVLHYVGAAAGFVTLIVAASGVWAIHGPFFSWPADFLKGHQAAAGIALINMLGACGGVLGPFLIGRLADASGGSYAVPMAALAAMDLIAAGLLIGFQEPQDEIWLEALPAIDDGGPNQDANPEAPRQLVLMPLRCPADSPRLGLRRLSTEDSDVAETQRLTGASPYSDLQRLATDDSETAGLQWVAHKSPRYTLSPSREGSEAAEMQSLTGKSGPSRMGGREEDEDEDAEQRTPVDASPPSAELQVAGSSRLGVTPEEKLTDPASFAMEGSDGEEMQEKLTDRSAHLRLLRSDSAGSEGEDKQKLTGEFN